MLELVDWLPRERTFSCFVGQNSDFVGVCRRGTCHVKVRTENPDKVACFGEKIGKLRASVDWRDKVTSVWEIEIASK